MNTDRYHSTYSGSQYGMAPRMLLASLALAAGAIHLAMAPIHAPESTTEALLFAGAGWAQILLGIALFVRPSREVLSIAIVVNVAAIVAYVISRTAGLPFGANPGEAESVDAIDLTTVIFEVSFVVAAIVLFIQPSFADGNGRAGATAFESIAIASALPLIVLFATSVQLADPDLLQHGHGGDESTFAVAGGHGHGTSPAGVDLVSLASNRCDLGLNPAAYWKETTIAGVDTLMGGEAGGLDHNAGARIEGSPELDKLISTQVTSEGEVGDAIMVMELSKVNDDVYTNWLRWLGASGMLGHAHEVNPLAPDDLGMGGHIGPQPWHAMTDDDQCAELSAELELARQTALKYPTVADAKAAGWQQVTPYVPGIAAHFMKFSIVDGVFNVEEPEMILYDGTDDDSSVVGLSYYIRFDGDAEPSQGFTGNNDHFHRHIGLCVGPGGVIGDSTTTEEECAALGGRKSTNQNGWMNHAWVVPGCESPWGMFSGVNPILDSDLSKTSGEDGGACAGSGVRERYDLSAGSPENSPTAVGGDIELVVND
jgi:hypothetical protein